MTHFDNASQAGSTGRSLRCQSCGAAFALPHLTPFVQCPHCQQQQQLPLELLSELQQYQQHVAQHHAAAQQHYQHADAWQRWTTGRASNPKKNFFVAYAFLLGPALLLAAVAAIVNQVGLLPGFFRGPGLSFTIMGLTHVGMGFYFVWYLTGAKKRKEQPGEQSANVNVACPNCGALGVLTPGAAVDTCSYCRTALVPSQTTVMRAVDAAEVHARRAQIERYRQERQGMANVQGYDASSWLPFILGGSFLLPCGGGAIALSVEMLRGKEPFNPAIFILWAATLGIAGGLVGFAYLRKSKRAAFKEALTHVLHQFPGSLHDRVDAVVNWLNRFWPARYQTQFLRTGPYAMAACVNARGFPALIYVDPVSSGQHHQAKLHLLVAAWPRANRQVDQASANAYHARLAQIGFQLSETDAGLMAIADAQTQKRAAKQPATLHELAPALTALTLFAEYRGMEPAQPIP